MYVHEELLKVPSCDWCAIFSSDDHSILRQHARYDPSIHTPSDLDGREVAKNEARFDTFDRAEFVIRQPTPILDGDREPCQVQHYSGIKVMPAKHTIFCVE